MAKSTDSAAAKRQRMVEAGYRTGFPQVQSQRCDTCRSSAPSTQFIGKTKSDMHCTHFNAGCKTHGACPLWSAPPVAVDSETAALLTSARDALLKAIERHAAARSLRNLTTDKDRA